MKVGILTFHCAHNYGAVLQAYALQQAIKELGHEVFIIDYKPGFLTQPYKLFDISRDKNRSFISNLFWEVYSIKKKLKKAKSFNRFVKKKLYIKKLTKGTVPRDIDFIVVGSDQVWNIELTNGFNKYYWGDVSVVPQKHKITYAVSMEHSLKSTDFDEVEKLTKNFQSISVRESNLKELLEAASNINISKVLDPTLLLKNDFWETKIGRQKTIEKYILIYSVRDNEEILRIANKISKKTGFKILEIKNSQYYIKKNSIPFGISPFEFVTYFKYASFIVTSSFHGTAFSIIFKKDFYTVRMKDGHNTRSESLLNDLNLSDRMVDDTSEIDLKKIDYNNTLFKLNELQTNSFDFLSSSLMNADSNS